MVLCLAGSSIAAYVMLEYRSIERVPNLDVAEAPRHNPENFVVLGSDSREDGPTDAAGQVEGRRSDTIMVVRVDPDAKRLALLSLPRDLIVTDPGGHRVMINSLYGQVDGEQVLIDTLRQDFGIDIHHYVEVDFQGFERLVDSIGGVSLWIPNALRDRHSGLFIDQLGCVRLDGGQALAFARARHLDYMTPDGWADDPRSDLSRIDRQQIFLRRAMAKALSQVRSDPLRLRELLDIGVSNIRVDDRLGLRDIMELADAFRDFGAEGFETYALPTVPNPADENRLLVDESEAEPILTRFRDLPPGAIGPATAGDPKTTDPAMSPTTWMPPTTLVDHTSGPVVGESPAQPCD